MFIQIFIFREQEDELSSQELNPAAHRKTLVKTILEGKDDLTDDNYNIDLTKSIKEFSAQYVRNVLNAISEKFFEIERRLSTPKVDAENDQSNAEDSEQNNDNDNNNSIQENEVSNQEINLRHLGKMSDSNSASEVDFDQISEEK